MSAHDAHPPKAGSLTTLPWSPELEARAKELLALATPRPWEVHWRVGAKWGPVVALVPLLTTEGCDFKKCPFCRWARARDYGPESYASYGGELVAEHCKPSNAQLIARAPELLEAAMAEIERLRREIDRHLFAGDDPRALGPLPEDQPTRRRR